MLFYFVKKWYWIIGVAIVIVFIMYTMAAIMASLNVTVTTTANTGGIESNEEVSTESQDTEPVFIWEGYL